MKELTRTVYSVDLSTAVCPGGQNYNQITSYAYKYNKGTKKRNRGIIW